MNLKDLAPKLSQEIKSFIQLINDNNYSATLVGGVCRDFLLTGKVSSDIDMELRYLGGKLTSQVDEIYWQKLKTLLAQKYETKILPYEIIQVRLKSSTAELSRPR